MSQQKLTFRFSQCKDEDESQNSSQVQPNDSSQPKEPDVSQHGSSELPNGPDNSSQPSSQTTNCSDLWTPRLSQNSQKTPENSQKDSQKSAENPAPRFPTEINLIDPAELGMNLDDFNQSEEVLNKSFRTPDISSQSSSDEKE